jgi:hypothetical protein
LFHELLRLGGILGFGGFHLARAVSSIPHAMATRIAILLAIVNPA